MTERRQEKTDLPHANCCQQPSLGQVMAKNQELPPCKYWAITWLLSKVQRKLGWKQSSHYKWQLNRLSHSAGPSKLALSSYEVPAIHCILTEAALPTILT